MTDGSPLDERYFKWLYSQIASLDTRNPARSYWKLCRHLYTKPFTWFVPNDENRAEDGRGLREEFLDEEELVENHDWMVMDCSVLEMLIALSRRAAFQASGAPDEWFWLIMDNVDLRQFNDSNFRGSSKHQVEEVLDRILERRYDYDGLGGLFPLEDPMQDQRRTELWYQLSAYLLERVDFDVGF